jgi:hypothetical protein
MGKRRGDAFGIPLIFYVRLPCASGTADKSVSSKLKEMGVPNACQVGVRGRRHRTGEG